MFSSALRQIREHRGLTQTDLARRVEMQPSSIGHFEAGRREPSLQNLIKLADGLGCSLDALAGRCAKSNWDLAYRRGAFDAVEQMKAATRDLRKSSFVIEEHPDE